MNLTVKFSGHVAGVIDQLLSRGIVSTKTEALRLGVLKLEEEYLKGGSEEALFDAWAEKEAERQDRLIGEGKAKLYSQKDFEKRQKAKK